MGAVNGSTVVANAASILFGRTRQRLLALFFNRPDETFHLRQVVRLVGTGMGAVQRDITALVESGILRRELSAGRVLYSVNRGSPIFSELRSIVMKTSGLVDVLKSALASGSSRIDAAFVFGSFARGEHHRGSDIDVFVVSDKISFDELVRLLGPAEMQIGREANPVLYRRNEIYAKIRSGNAFLRRVVASEKVFVAGTPNEFAGMVEKRMASPTSAGARRNSRADGSGGSRSARLPRARVER